MTCEIAIMNRQAIVLAADSATTITRWVEGQKEERYFKGANKIFQLSHQHPVGLMIFAGANLHGVPWEILIKDFRDHLADKSFNSLEGYANEFFEFIATHAYLFPTSYQEKIFLDEAEKVAWTFLVTLAPKEQEVLSSTAREDRTEAYRAVLQRWQVGVNAQELPPRFNDGDVDVCRAKYFDRLIEIIGPQLTYELVDADIDARQLAELAITALIKRYRYTMEMTGVVFA